MHLWLNDINAAMERISTRSLKIMHCNQAGAKRIQQTLANLAALPIKHRRIGHQVTHIADQHQRPPLQAERRSINTYKVKIGVQTPGMGFATLGDFFRQITAHQAQPVPIGQNFVAGINRSDAVFAIHDRRERGFQPDIGNARSITRTDRAVGFNVNDDMQAIVAQ